MTKVTTLVFCLFLAFNLPAQQEFIMGRSAGALAKNQTNITLSPSIPFFTDLSGKRLGISLDYGLTDRITIGSSGSITDFYNIPLQFENGYLRIKYRALQSEDHSSAIAVFAEASVVSELFIPRSEVLFDGTTAGLMIGFVANKKIQRWTTAFSLARAKISQPSFSNGLLNGAAYVYQLSGNLSLSPSSNKFRLAFISELLGQFNNDIGLPNLLRIPKGSYLDYLIGFQADLGAQWKIALGQQGKVYNDLISDPNFRRMLHLKLRYLIN